jgi:hypothetical protein
MSCFERPRDLRPKYATNATATFAKNPAMAQVSAGFVGTNSPPNDDATVAATEAGSCIGAPRSAVRPVGEFLELRSGDFAASGFRISQGAKGSPAP